jgi:RNA-directed DNA polymerase
MGILALRPACMAAARGKRRSPEVAAFLLDPAAHVDALSRDLDSHAYRPGPGRAFWIQDPKRRRIFALPFRDRVAQHVLVAATLPSLERWFAPQSYACRSGKGTHRCLRRAIELTRTKRFVLRIDIRKFFPSIDHAILRALLDPLTPPELRWLRDAFLDAPVGCEHVAWHFPGDDLFAPFARPHGLPIGSLTSQVWANVFLTPVDHLLASHCGLGTFVRYCDDVLVFDDDRDRLRDALLAVEERASALRLRLHPVKTRLHRTADPVAFLGFVPRRVKDGVQVRLRTENAQRFRQRMSLTLALFESGAVDPAEVIAQIRAWLAHARHGHTRTLCERELSRLVFVRAQVPSPAACP